MTILFARSVSCGAESLVEVVTTNGPTVEYTLTRVAENDQSLSFVIEATGPVRLRIAPRQWAVHRGREYSVNTSFFGPFIVQADNDGELVFALDKPLNCTVVVEPLPGTHLLCNGGFEGAELGELPRDWELRTEGAPDRNALHPVTFTTDEPGSNKFLLRIQHQVVQGLSAVRTQAATPVEPGQRYLMSATYRAARAPFGTRLLLMAEFASADKPTRYEQNEEVFVATRAGEWRRWFKTVTVPSDLRQPTVRITLGVSGAPVEVDFKDVEFRRAPAPAEQFSKPFPVERRTPRRSRQEVEALWKNRPPVAVQVPTSGQPLRIDGQIEPLYWLASDYWPGAWPAKTAHRDFAEAGVRVQAIPLHAWHRAGVGAWQGDGVYDFSTLDESLAYVLGLDDAIRVILYASLEPYPAFCDQHPEAAWVDGRGHTLVGEKEHARDGMTRKPGEPLAHSLTAPTYRNVGSDYLRALAQHLNTSPLGKAVVGLHIVAGTDGQWFSPDWRPGASDYDYSEGARAAFADWLRRRYNGNLAAFRQAWGNEALTFETATLPEDAERSPEKWFLDPALGADRRVMDANVFSDAGKMETLNTFARAFKEALGRPVMVTAYLHNKLHANHVWLEAPWVDGTVAVQEYALWRGLGNTGEIATYPASLRLHGKFFVQELDYRTENAETWGADAQESARHELSITFGPQEGAAQLRRDLGASLAQGGGAWHYCLMGNSWNHPEHLANIREAQAAACRGAEEVDSTSPPVESAALLPESGANEPAQMAVFFDEETEHWATRRNIYGPTIRHYSYYGARYALNRSGISWDSYLLSDLGHPRLPEYKLYVFLAAGGLTESQVRFIRERLQRDGKVLYFAYHAGWFAPAGFTSTIRQLTGMNVSVDLSEGTECRFLHTGMDSLNEGVDTLDHGFGGPRFFVDDATAIPLATLTGTTDVGLAVKRHGTWTSVYAALPGGFTPRFLRGLAREAGLVPIGPEDDVTYAGHGFLILHALSDGEKTLRWEGPADVTDLTTGCVLARGVNQLTISMLARETRWFRLFPHSAVRAERPGEEDHVDATSSGPCAVPHQNDAELHRRAETRPRASAY